MGQRCPSQPPWRRAAPSAFGWDGKGVLKRESRSTVARMDLISRLKQHELPYPQGTSLWLKARSCMLTASDVGAALGVNPYETRQDLIRYKAGLEKRCVDPIFVGFGHRYEDEAADAYSRATGRSCFSLGLVRHPLHRWLGASPDRVTFCGRVVEIKVPYKRKFMDGQGIPEHYLAQVQTQLFVLGLDVADFVQYDPRDGSLRIDEVVREPNWWAINGRSLMSFQGKVLDIRADHEMQAWEEEETGDGVTCMVPSVTHVHSRSLDL